ncbi:MAG TPA: hypothetical protein VE258_05145, partial [Ktedonobacterales bacterium]|nr:hypothetical protein [Ktedonobacterales bacterium]
MSPTHPSHPSNPPHPDEAELVMRLCGEESSASAASAASVAMDAALDAHLARCGECRALFAALRETLALVDAAPLPHRGESYGAEVWGRIRPHLEAESRHAPGWWALLFQPRTWALAGTMAGLLLVAFFAGRHWPLPSEPISGAARERILLVAVGDHLERAQMMLVELVNLNEVKNSGAPIDIAPAQRRAEDLVTANRLYRQASAGAGDAAT